MVEETKKSEPQKEVKELKKSVGEVQIATTPRPPVEEPVKEPKEKKN